MAAIREINQQESDEASLALAYQLQLEDIATIFDKGKSRADGNDDEKVAFKTFQDEIATATQSLQDHRISRSIATALQSDHALLSREMRANEIALRDRDLARQLSGEGHGRRSPTQPCKDSDGRLSGEHLAKLAALYVSEQQGVELLAGEESDSDLAESSAAGSRRRGDETKVDRVCDSCGDAKKFFEVSRLPCEHEYCKDCLDELFSLSLHDESLFPPKCCRQTIPIESVKPFLSSTTAKSFLEKSPELSTPNRTYCHAAECGKWIPPDKILNQIGTCTYCTTLTCVMCKKKAHSGDCPADEALKELLDTAKERGWQRCFSCRRIVELNIGCNHITCRCGMEFCYVCGQRWKTCSCRLWEEQRLYARAEQIFDRGQRQQDVHEIAQNLARNRHCIHEMWQKLEGRYRCEECEEELHQFIFQCVECDMRACLRCRHNRML